MYAYARHCGRNNFYYVIIFVHKKTMHTRERVVSFLYTGIYIVRIIDVCFVVVVVVASFLFCVCDFVIV